MKLPRRLLFLPIFAAIVTWPGQALGQPVQAPALVDGELSPEEVPPQRQAEPQPAEPRAKGFDEAPHPPVQTERAAPARLLQLVHATYADLVGAFEGYRDELRHGDLDRAKAARERVMALKAELGIEALDAFAMVEARAAHASTGSSARDAVDRAEFAVALAPDLPPAHFALARARLAQDARQFGPALREVGAGMLAAVRGEGERRNLLGDVSVIALVGVAVAAAVIVAVAAARHLRLLFHDVQHLPVLRHAPPLQAAFFALVLLALPVALGLGPAVLLATLTVAAAPYLSRWERFAVTVALTTVALLPAALDQVSVATAWSGTLAEEIAQVERGEDDGRLAARLGARPGLPRVAMVALGRHHKRRGELALALKTYEAAGDRPDALVNLGNVRFLQGDLDAAQVAYLAALDRAGGDATVTAAACYDLSKVFLREAALDRAQEFRRRAAQASPDLVERRGSDTDERANAWLIDVPVSDTELAEVARADAPRHLGKDAARWLGGSLPPGAWPWLPLAAALLAWVIALLGRRLRPSARCSTCGLAACTRCGSSTQEQCVQCVHAFAKSGLVDARDRLEKEAAVRRHGRTTRFAARALAMVGAGHLWRGEAIRGALVAFLLGLLVSPIVFRQGLLPALHARAWLPLWRLATCLPLALVVWVVAARDVFRRTRERDRARR